MMFVIVCDLPVPGGPCTTSPFATRARRTARAWQGSAIVTSRSRPEEIVHQPWLDKQWSKVLRALDMLNATPPKLGRKIHGGHIALRAALGYLDLRFQGKWEKGRGKLKRWAARFDEKFPELAALLPR